MLAEPFKCLHLVEGSEAGYDPHLPVPAARVGLLLAEALLRGLPRDAQAVADRLPTVPGGPGGRHRRAQQLLRLAARLIGYLHEVQVRRRIAGDALLDVADG